MADIYKSKFTGEAIDSAVELLSENVATEGQVLTADGAGKAVWADPSGAGGSAGGQTCYRHNLLITAGSTTHKLCVYTDKTMSAPLVDIGGTLNFNNHCICAYKLPANIQQASQNLYQYRCVIFGHLFLGFRIAMLSFASTDATISTTTITAVDGVAPTVTDEVTEVPFEEAFGLGYT